MRNFYGEVVQVTRNLVRFFTPGFISSTFRGFKLALLQGYWLGLGLGSYRDVVLGLYRVRVSITVSIWVRVRDENSVSSM